MKLRLLFLVVLAATTTSFSRRFQPYSGPLEISYWYWHTPFRISRSDSATLRQMGVTRLFVRAGTFAAAHSSVHVTLPQQWESTAEQDVILVFNEHRELLRDFGKFPNSDLAAGMQTGIRSEIERAERAGIRVTGIQLDVDCSTRLLPKYAELLCAIRRDVRLSLSITALPTWLATDGFRKVAEAVDFVVPQFYEGRIAKDVRDFAPISSPDGLARGLARMESLGKPFYAGLPAYGHALAYGGTGKLLGGYSDMDAVHALSHPALKLIGSFAATPSGGHADPAGYSGESILKLVPADMRPENPDGPDHGMGRKPYYLVYDIPSPVMLSKNLNVLRDRRPANCRGIILYRFPGAGDPMALPLAASAELLANRKPDARLGVEVDRLNPSWDVIDTGSARSSSQHEFSLAVTN